MILSGDGMDAFTTVETTAWNHFRGPIDPHRGRRDPADLDEALR
jgi:hypothetical protein